MNEETFSLIGADVPPGFELVCLTLGPGGQHDVPAGALDDALLVVERGTLRVRCASGAVAVFGCGAVVPGSGLRLRALANAGSADLVVSLLSRRADEHRPADASHQVDDTPENGGRNRG